MSEEVKETEESSEPLELETVPHAWLPVVLGVVSCSFLFVVSVMLINQHLKSRPIDLLALSEKTALSLELFLRDHQVSADQVSKNAPIKIMSPQAHYYQHDYTVHLSPGVKAQTIERQLGQKMLSKALVIKDLIEADQHSGISIAYDVFPVATIKFVEARLPGFMPSSATESFEPSEEQRFISLPTLNTPNVEPEEKPLVTDAAPQVDRSNEASSGWRPPTASPVDDIQLARVPLIKEAAPSELLAPEPAKAMSEVKGKLVIIVDDGGYGQDYTDKILALNPKLTLSILPNTPHAARIAKEGYEKGFEIMLHMPMENTGEKNVHEGQLNTDMDEATILKLTEDALKQVPHAKGINNHTGSKFTTNPKAMALFIDAIKDKNLFFIDSKTASATKAYEIASAFGIPSERSDLFLDNPQATTQEQVSEIKKRFEQIIELSIEEGEAIAICHFRPTTATVLAELLPTLKSRGIELVHASELVK